MPQVPQLAVPRQLDSGLIGIILPILPKTLRQINPKEYIYMLGGEV
jgi:hypothetical protein